MVDQIVMRQSKTFVSVVVVLCYVALPVMLHISTLYPHRDSRRTILILLRGLDSVPMAFGMFWVAFTYKAFALRISSHVENNKTVVFF